MFAMTSRNTQSLHFYSLEKSTRESRYMNFIFIVLTMRRSSLTQEFLSMREVMLSMDRAFTQSIY